jgi:hypothetical protein
MLIAEQGSIAGDESLGIANLPIAAAHEDPARETLIAANYLPLRYPKAAPRRNTRLRAWHWQRRASGRLRPADCARLSLCGAAAVPIVVGTGTPNDKAWTWTDGKNYRADYEHDALS